MDRLNSFSNESSSRQYLEKLGLASNEKKSKNADRISKELLHLPIDALNNELNNSSLQFHLKAENNRISYKIVDFGRQNKRTNYNSFVDRDLSTLASLSALAEFEQSTQANMGRVAQTRSGKRKQPPAHTSPSISSSPTNGDPKNNAEKRSKHNEIERKRRDKINNWIIKLSKIVPDCTDDSSKQSQSKGVILSKACDYISDLKKSNSKLSSVQEENSRLRKELSECRKDFNELSRENDQLRSLIKENRITIKEPRNKK